MYEVQNTSYTDEVNEVQNTSYTDEWSTKYNNY